MITLPTLSSLYDDYIAALETEYGITIDPDGKTVLRALAAAQAAKLKGFYLAIGALQKNIFVDTCDEETLLRFGKIKLGRLPFSAVAGQYRVSVTGTVGATIPALTTFKSDDSSLNPEQLYILDAAFTFTSGSGTITLRALTLGLDGKLSVSDTLTPTAPIPNVSSGPSSASVSSELVQPLSAETTEAYRTAVIASYRLEAQGGAASDYRIWASDAQGVAKVYPYAKSGATSEVNLYVEATADDSTDGKGTPSQAILDEVEEVVNFNPDTTLPLNERGRRPLQVIVNYLPVTIKTVVITISGFQGLTAAIQATLLSELQAELDDIRPFVAGADIIEEKNDILDNNKVINTILTARPGSIFTGVSFTIDGVSYSTYTFQNGDIPYLNPTIVYN